jgi:hypothetical protein
VANGTYLHVASNTTASGAVVSPNSGSILVRVVINTVGSAGNTLTIYDGTSTSGKVIAVANTTNNAVPALEYNIVAATGIWYTLLSGGAADLTFIYM